jgi:DNA-binding beta-propeller fold protein YncE
VVDPTGDFVYVTDSAGGVVSVFAVGAGNALTFLASYATAAVTRETFDLALANNAAALFLYATNGMINTVSDFAVSSGVLSLQGATGGLSGPEGIVSDPAGDFVYVANNATGQIFGYEVGSDGSLTSIGAFDTESPANPASAPAFLAITQ